MSALKNLLKSDTPTSASNSGSLSGQGSHFARASDKPTTVTGTDPQTVGAPDSSASVPPPSQASATAGPEAGGQSHVGTIPAASETGANKSFPSTLREDGSGTAAIGQTTTYSSRPLASGDPTPSVIDHESKDPLTYKFPEHGHESTSGGVPAGSAAAAAAQAWKSQGEQMPGGYPSAGYENPYKASHPLDPRVDGGKLGSQVDSSTSTPSKATGLGSSIGSPETSTPSHAVTSSSTASGPDYRHGPSDTSSAALGAGAGAGAAGLAASKAVEHPSATQSTSASSGPAPSTLTTTADPTDRSATYSASTATQGLDHASSTTAPSSSAPTTQSTTQPEQQGIAGKVLGALGLGGAAGAAASALGYGDKSSTSAVDDGPRDTTAIAAQPGQSTLETGPPKHYRRESIPTTAYPGGPTSPRAVAPPVGGTQIGQSEVPRESGRASFHDLTTTGSGNQATTSTVPVSAAQPSSSEDHTSRNVAAGGAAAAVAGAGAYGLHEHNKQVPATSSTTQAPDAGVLHGTSAPTTSTGIPTQPSAATGTTTLPNRTRDVTTPADTTTASTSRDVQAPIVAVAAAPSRYDGQDAAAPSSLTSTNEPLKKEEDHTARNTALGAGAGTAVAGGAAYAAHEHSEKEAARRVAEQEKELAKQREHDQKEAARAEKEHQKKIEEEEKHARKEAEKAEKEHQKEIEKEQKAARKEEEHHQKELAKEEKKHQKEAEKEEKEHQAALLAAEKREQARLASEEEDRKRREREAAAGVGAATFTGAGMTAHEKYETDKDAAPKEKEKKPSIFKRIFKRRKNKDTGLDEDYSTDDEEDKAAKSAVPAHHSDTKGRTVLGPATTGRASAEQPRDSVTGLTYDPSKDPEAASRLSREPGSLDNTAATGRGTDGAPLGIGSAAATEAGAKDTRPIEPTTGMPYDPSKDPEAARRLEERDLSSSAHPSATGASHVGGTTGTTGTTATGPTTTGLGQSGETHLPATATEPFGVIGDHHR